MRQAIFPSVLVALLAVFAVSLWSDGARLASREGLIGQPAPLDHPLIGQGEPVLVNFWFSTCGPCRAEHPFLMDLAAQDMAVLGINRDVNLDDAAAFLDELGDPYADKLYDPRDALAQLFQVEAWPTSFLVAGNGIIQGIYGPLIDPAAKSDLRLVQAPETLFQDPEREAQAQGLFGLINCLDCDANSVRESNGNFALQMRKLVRSMMDQGFSKAEIRNLLIERYGAQIWLSPPFGLGSIILYALPLLGFLIGAFVLMRRGRST